MAPSVLHFLLSPSLLQPSEAAEVVGSTGRLVDLFVLLTPTLVWWCQA